MFRKYVILDGDDVNDGHQALPKMRWNTAQRSVGDWKANEHCIQRTLYDTACYLAYTNGHLSQQLINNGPVEASV